MATLTDTELEKLFSGAPQYFARSEGPNTGAPNPSVAFPWDETLDIRDLTDHAQIEDEAWGCVTALPHITRTAWRRLQQQQQQRASTATATAGSSTAGPSEEKKRAHFFPKCRERPNMLSIQGLEKGTAGYSAALELAVADSMQEAQFGFDSLGRKANAVVEARQKMLASKDGLRHLEESAIMEQLIKNGRRYQDKNVRDDTRSTDLYNELFLQVLHPPTRVLDHNDPYSLSVQIQALLKVLGAANVWVDFSRVEWRIRLGQVLWGSTAAASVSPASPTSPTSPSSPTFPTPAGPTADEDHLEDGTGIRTAGSAEERYEERYWLLLQILLACELWIRLDAITEADEARVEQIKPREIYRFNQDATPSVKWSMLLARSWLENVEVTKTEPQSAQQQQQHESTHGHGWLATLTKRISGSGEHHGATANLASSRQSGGSELLQLQPVYAMKGRHGQRQAEGLTHFARRLRWPDIEAHEARVAESLMRAAAENHPLSSPLASPLSADGRRTSYFGSSGPKSPSSAKAMTPNHAREFNFPPRQTSKRRRVFAALHPSGWLAKSFISGLILPGEGIEHFLMAALLENDSEAMARLGPSANLSGGFVYRGKSFWSTTCVVGRVIAAGKGSVECMGWISSDVTPQGMGDGWVNIEVQDIPNDVMQVGKQARIWGKLAIERESSVLGTADPSSVFPADFVIPFENIYNKDMPPPSCNIELRALKLFAPVDSVHTTPTDEVPPSKPLSKANPKAGAPAKITTTPRPAPEIHTYPVAVTFSVTKFRDDMEVDGAEEMEVEEEECTFCLSNDVFFVTAHPCVPSTHVKILKSPSSPTIRQIDLSGNGTGGKAPNSATITGHPLHKYYNYTAMHLTELIARRDATLEELLNGSESNISGNLGPDNSKPQTVAQLNRPSSSSSQPPGTPKSPTVGTHSRHSSAGSTRSSSSRQAPRVLVVDCITGFQPLPQEHEVPLSPVVSRSSTDNIPPTPQSRSSSSSGDGGQAGDPEAAGASHKMHSETRRRQFGSDMEILVRALCAEKGWNAMISRRRRGCLACAIREAGALGWRVIFRVD